MKNKLSQQEKDEIIKSIINVLEPAIELAYIRGQTDAMRNEAFYKLANNNYERITKRKCE